MGCKCGCGGVPHDSFMQFLVTVREEASFPFVVSSGFRCAKRNEEIRGAGNSAHLLGLAADIRCYGDEALRLVYLAVKHGVSGIGVSQKGGIDSRFIHVDTVPRDSVHPRPWIWSY